MASRYFVNRFADFAQGGSVEIQRSKWKELIESVTKTISEKMAPTLDNCDGGLYVGNAGVAYMFYYIANCEAFADKRQFFLEKAFEYFGVAIHYSKQSRDPGPSFILGTSGVVAVGCLISKALGNHQLCAEYTANYASYANEVQKLNFLRCGSDELFVGRAGYLCGIWNLEKKFGQKVVNDKDVFAICTAVVESGRQYARRHKSPSPLMYAYYDTEYLGAAHGLSSILQMLLCFPQYLQADRAGEQDIRQAVDFMLSLEQPNNNYAPAMDEVQGRRSDSQELVHWCHGAPGIVYLFARAYRVWGDDKYLQACLRCGEITWQRGLLKKGPGICHGVAGSGYVFLLLYRLTGDQKHLHRALQFAEFLFTPEFQSGAKVPDSPYSLYEGWAGTVCFLVDLLQADRAEFPLFDIF